MNERNKTSAPMRGNGRNPTRQAAGTAMKKAWEACSIKTKVVAGRAWAACVVMAGKTADGAKALWTIIHPSVEAKIKELNGKLSINHARLEALKPELEKTYAEIVEKKAIWQKSAEARQRLLKAELATLLIRYKAFEREFSVLNENARTLEAVRGRYLELRAYELRGKLDEDQVDALGGLVGEKAGEADDVQAALGDLEKVKRRQVGDKEEFEDELAAFDGELGLSSKAKPATEEKSKTASATSEGDADADSATGNLEHG